ncbi:MAG: hypothetical protein KC912_11320 [Proteobacteria bacterium]|nr:hypothetical protein [Pseudomonadota bacterium]
MRLIATLALLQSTTAFAGECPEPISSSAWNDRVTSTEALYSAFEFDQFRTSVQELALDLPCLGEALAPSQAARYHRVVGIDLFIRRRTEPAAQSFAAARSAEPDFNFSTELIPEEHAIRDLYASAPSSGGAVDALAAPLSGVIRIDGSETLERPRSTPTIFQYIDADGATQTTSYLVPTAITPSYPVAPAATDAVTSSTPGPAAVGTTGDEVLLKKKKPTLLIAGSAMLLAGTASAAGALAQNGVMKGAQVGEVEKVDKAFARQQVFGYSAYGLWGLGALTAGAHFVF